MLPRLSPGGVSVPKIEDKAFMLAFFKSERSRVQLTTGGGQDRRIRVRIDYNLRQAYAVEAVIEELVSIGFRETWRASSAAR
jgi:hypothetical protein